MKQLNIPQPLLLLVIGYPGAGKSNLAHQLAERFGVAWVHGNRLRYELFSEPTFAKHEEDVVNNLAEYLLSEMLRTKGHVVFDGNTNTRIARQRLANLGKKAGYKVVTVWVQTDIDTAFARSSKRRTKKETDDTYATRLNREIFDRMASQLAKPLPHELCVVVSGKHTSVAQISALRSKLESLYAPASHPAPAKRATASPKAPPRKVAKPKRVVDGPHASDKTNGRPSAHPDQRSKPRFDIMRRIKIR
jgi:predicted kinase